MQSLVCSFNSPFLFTVFYDKWPDCLQHSVQIWLVDLCDAATATVDLCDAATATVHSPHSHKD